MKTLIFFTKLLLLSFIISSCSKDDNTFIPSASDINQIIDENPSNGLTIGTIATNLTGTLHYNIISESVPNTFAVNSATGAVTVNDGLAFDFETSPTLTATVSVTNSSETATSKVTVTLNDTDDIFDFLSTSKSAYAAASIGAWIIITENEYNTLAISLNEVNKVSILDSDYEREDTVYYDSSDYTYCNDNNVMVPNQSYVFAFKYRCEDDGINTTKVKLSTTSASEGFIDIGNVLPTHNAGDNYFLLKSNNTPTNGDAFLGMGPTKSAYINISEDYTFKYNGGDSNMLTATWKGIALYQGLCTTQKQWD